MSTSSAWAAPRGLDVAFGPLSAGATGFAPFDSAPSPGVDPRLMPGLLATVAHELRTPLSALSSSAELLAGAFEGLTTEKLRGTLTTMHRGTLWLRTLLDNLLCAATMADGRFQVHARPIDLVDVVEEVRPIVEPLLHRQEQRLHVSWHGEAPRVHADPQRVGQVLVNLVCNAGKYSHPGTSIELALVSGTRHVEVSVADRGPGLPDGGVERLFAPFERVAWVRHTGKDGVGLGLAIVRAIVEAHGGQLGAENRPGGGARFWFRLNALSKRSSAQARFGVVAGKSV